MQLYVSIRLVSVNYTFVITYHNVIFTYLATAHFTYNGITHYKPSYEFQVL